MNDGEKKIDTLLNRAIRETRETVGTPHEREAARSRIRERLSRIADDGSIRDAAAGPARAIEGCADHRALIPALVAGSLPETKRWLVEEHLRGCPACRAAHEDAREPGRAANARPAAAVPSAARVRRAWLRPALAAAAVLAVAALAGWITQGYLPAALVSPASVTELDGSLFRIAGDASEPVAREAALRAGETVRTAKGSGAVVTLSDGSRIELAERSEISFGAGWRDTIVRLQRGSVIVKAADQEYGRLFVRTGDCSVAVKGTVFSVTSATKGSRVSVLEGEVHVHAGRERSVLLAGDQMTTHASMSPVPLDQEIRWSRNVDEHLALMKEMIALGKELDRVPRPGLRYDAPLLDVVPESTIVYAGIPNLADALAQSYEVIRERVSTNATLDRWWEENVVATGAEPEIERTIERLVEFGELLGDEVVVAVGATDDGDEPDLLVMAELRDEDSFVALLERELAAEAAPSGGDVTIVRGPTPSPVATDEGGLRVWVHDGLLALSPSWETLGKLAATRAAGDASPFTATGLHARLREGYRAGAGLIVGADLGRILGAARSHGSGEDSLVLEQLGILDAEHLIVERKRTGDRTTSLATVFFDGPRKGLAGWVARPAPMGALEFVSPEAHLAAGFVISDPAALVRDLFERIEAGDGDFATHLESFEKDAGISVVDDIAAPLGGEFAFALDGPVLPTPAWRLVIEVYDEARLQRTIEWAVSRVNDDLAQTGTGGLVELTTKAIGGRDVHTLRGTGAVGELNYVYTDGYLIAAPNAALLERALQNRRNGYQLISSPAFKGLLPPDGPDNFSAVVYQSLGSLIGPLAGTIGLAGGLTEEQQTLIGELAAESQGSLTYAYGLDDRIVIASSGRGPLAGELSGLLGFGGLANLHRTMAGAIGASLAEHEEAVAH
ncbi:MAG: FecR domain-containing protein [Acidobacteriota bacterium]|nr:FecR domain-containing protein [Acidobacteriota bacterium]